MSPVDWLEARRPVGDRRVSPLEAAAMTQRLIHAGYVEPSEPMVWRVASALAGLSEPVATPGSGSSSEVTTWAGSAEGSQ